ncbi:hypothetical protein D3C75_993430 [compost metagenome]
MTWMSVSAETPAARAVVRMNVPSTQTEICKLATSIMYLMYTSSVARCRSLSSSRPYAVPGPVKTIRRI